GDGTLSASCYALSLHDALPICEGSGTSRQSQGADQEGGHLAPGDGIVRTEPVVGWWVAAAGDVGCGEAGDVAFEHVACRVGEGRSEEHTSELQSRENVVCRLLL